MTLREVVRVSSVLGVGLEDTLDNPSVLLTETFTPGQYQWAHRIISPESRLPELDIQKAITWGRNNLRPFVEEIHAELNLADEIIKKSTDSQVNGDSDKTILQGLSALGLGQFEAALSMDISDFKVWAHLAGVEAAEEEMEREARNAFD